MAFAVRIGVALCILIPFFVAVPSPPTWQIFLAACVAFGTGHIASSVAGLPKRPVSSASDRLEPLPTEMRSGRPQGAGVLFAVIVVVVLGGAVVGLWVRDAQREREAVEAARAAEGRAPASRAQLRGFLGERQVAEEPELTIDLDGAIARMPSPSGWSTDLGDGAFTRPSPLGPFLVETLLVQSDCFGPCDTLDANIDALASYWIDNRPAYSMLWTLHAGELRRTAPHRVELDVELQSAMPDRPSARARVIAIRPAAAKKAVLCELVIYGDTTMLTEAASVCDTIADH